jgi:hypothetical protein
MVGMGQAWASARAIFKDVLEIVAGNVTRKVARNVARNGIFHLRWD